MILARQPAAFNKSKADNKGEITMLLDLKKAIKNKEKIKSIMSNHCDKQLIDIILRDYIPYQGNSGYSGIFKQNIKELAIKAVENKKFEISKIIQDEIFEILSNPNLGVHNE
jgi:hypothetical protein